MKGDLEKRILWLLEDKNRMRNTIVQRERTIRRLQGQLSSAIAICEQQQDYIAELEARPHVPAGEERG